MYINDNKENKKDNIILSPRRHYSPLKDGQYLFDDKGILSIFNHKH